ncbi:hypothetical protein P5V15_001225 [Pogonomyrmex californicus]
MGHQGNYGRDPPIFDDRAAAEVSDDDENFDIEIEDSDVEDFMGHGDAQAHFRRVREWLTIVNQFYVNGTFYVCDECIWFATNEAPGRIVELPWSVELYELFVCLPGAIRAAVVVEDEELEAPDDPVEVDEIDMEDDPAADPAQARDRSPGV